MKKAIVFLGTIILVSVLMASCASNSATFEYKHTLNALQMRQGVSGTFFLGSGKIGTDAAYVFSETDTEGFNAIKVVSSTKAVYIEDITQGETPYVEYYKCPDGGLGPHCMEYTRGVPQVLKANDGGIYGGFYIFHIPTGTMTSVYNLGFTPQETDE